MPPLRVRTRLQRSSGSDANSSSGRGVSTIQSSLSSSSSSWPGPQPAWPAKTRVRCVTAADSAMSARADRSRRRRDQQPRGARVGEGGEHDDGVRLHRPADVDRLTRADQLLQLRRAVADRRLRRPVEHEAHRALVCVLGDEHDRAREVRILERRRCQQQLPLERVHAPILAYRGGLSRFEPTARPARARRAGRSPRSRRHALRTAAPQRIATAAMTQSVSLRIVSPPLRQMR